MFINRSAALTLTSTEWTILMYIETPTAKTGPIMEYSNPEKTYSIGLHIWIHNSLNEFFIPDCTKCYATPYLPNKYGWSFVGFTWKSNNLTFWRDDIPIFSEAVDPLKLLSANGDINLGKRPDEATWQGSIACFMMIRRKLNQSEIAEAHNDCLESHKGKSTAPFLIDRK